MNFFVTIAMLSIFTGCAYRFTNQYAKTPGGARLIAIEAVYDTGRTPLSHEWLWDSLQRAFATDGHLRVVPRGSADALLRAHITTANIAPTGSAEVNGAAKDENPKASPPPAPSKFRILSQAGEYTVKDNVRYSVNIELIDLRSGRVVATRSYSGSADFRSARSDALVQRKSQFLHYEESLQAKVRSIADKIASNVVTDLVYFNQ